MAKSYITIKTSEIDTVNFSQVIGDRESTRFSVDDSEFIVKWRFGAPSMPTSIEDVPEADRSLILTHLQARELMNTPEWTTPPE